MVGTLGTIKRIIMLLRESKENTNNASTLTIYYLYDNYADLKLKCGALRSGLRFLMLPTDKPICVLLPDHSDGFTLIQCFELYGYLFAYSVAPRDVRSPRLKWLQFVFGDVFQVDMIMYTADTYIHFTLTYAVFSNKQ